MFLFTDTATSFFIQQAFLWVNIVQYDGWVWSKGWDYGECLVTLLGPFPQKGPLTGSKWQILWLTPVFHLCKMYSVYNLNLNRRRHVHEERTVLIFLFLICFEIWMWINEYRGRRRRGGCHFASSCELHAPLTARTHTHARPHTCAVLVPNWVR